MDAASWYSQGVSRFGVLTPAIAESSSASTPLESAAEAQDATDEGLERPGARLAAWAVSTAPEGGSAHSVEGQPSFLRLNGTDAHLRQLTAVLTRAPAGGNLSIAKPLGMSTAEGSAEHPFQTGDFIPLGTRLVYRPEPGGHDGWPDISLRQENKSSASHASGWARDTPSYDWLSYRVKTEGGEVSANEAVVTLSVRLKKGGPQLVWAKKVREQQTAA